MKIISQLSLFGDTFKENLGDLFRLETILAALPDERLIQKLQKVRGKGRNEWSVTALWNSFIASFIFDHASVASLLRELNRNSQLRMTCGFEPHFYRGKDKTEKMMLAPTASAYSNFLKNLMKCQKELEEIFHELVRFMYANLSDFGDILMVDGKAIQSFGKKISKKIAENVVKEMQTGVVKLIRQQRHKVKSIQRQSNGSDFDYI